MSTKLLKKITGLVCALAIGVICFVGCYTVYIARAKGVELQKNFYFLVSANDKIEVSTEMAKLGGGAGYLLETEEGEYVAWSVYLSKEEGLAVQEGVEEDTTLLHKGVSRLYFKGGNKKKSSLYINALRILEGYITVLEESISRLEKGATQESCKRILSLLQRQFAYTEKEYDEYSAFSTACGEWSQWLKEILEKTVYVKDLRYLLCWQVEKYLQLCAAFTL